MTSGLTPSPFPDVITWWQAVLDNLSPHASLCRYLAPTKWAAIRENAIEFCDRLGAEAYRLGWTAAELFAVHPGHGTARIDACGVLMIGPEAARGVEAIRHSDLEALLDAAPFSAATEAARQAGVEGAK